MDKKSYQLANFILGNPKNAPCLEITLIGPEILIEGHGQMVLTGADLSPRLNGKAIQLLKIIDLHDGDKITFGACRSGCRCYLAMRGEWQLPKWLGSYCPVPYAGALENLPPPILRNDEITVLYHSRAIFRKFDRKDNKKLEKIVRVIPGPEYDLFTAVAQSDLLNRAHRISSQSNRMGYRIEGKLNGYEPLPELISSAVIPGTVQVTRSGQMVILMADAQTTGGYHRIAVVVQEDLDILAQFRPGEEIRFRLKN
jgi:antagonist of KipI